MNELADKKNIHIFYSHKDGEQLDRIEKEIRPLLGNLLGGDWKILHNDVDSGPGEWYPFANEGKAADNGNNIALLLVSTDLLASAFFKDLDISLSKQSKNWKTPIVPLILRSSDWQNIPLLADHQVVPKDGKPLSDGSGVEFHRVIREVAEAISNAFAITKKTPPVSQKKSSTPATVTVKQTSKAIASIQEDSEEPGLVPLARLSEFNLSSTVRNILSPLIYIQDGTIPISTSAIFFSMIVRGGVSRTVDTSRFLASFIMQRAEAEYFPVFDKYLKSRGISESEFTYLGFLVSKKTLESAHGALTTAVYEILQKAKQFSDQTTERGQIHRGQLFAALINKAASGEKIGFHSRLDELRIPLDLLQNEFLIFAKRNHKGSEGDWEKFVFNKTDAPKARVTRLAGYQADDANGDEDWLQIDSDVNAFAALIASRTVSPPLSIGLFGEWGSGKTFFMRRLRKRVSDLTKGAQISNKMQRDIPYYKRIAQIEFNAWHYVESNLWASLVEHIFDNLRVAGEENEQIITKLQKHLLEKLKLEKTAQRQANEKAENAERDFKIAGQKLKEIEDKLAKDNNRLYQNRAIDILATIDLPSPVQAEINVILTELNITQVDNEAQSFIGALNEARILMERGNTLLTPLIKANDRGFRLFWLIVCLMAAPVIGIAVIFVKQQMHSEWITEGVAVLGGIATFLGAGAAWIRSQAGWISKWLGKTEHAQQQINAKIAEREAQVKATITALERQIDISKVKYEAALQERDATKQRVVDAQAELRNITSERLLAKFIQDRAASDDYRKHLGILALVRNDFENLSNYIEEQNWRLSPIGPTEEANSKLPNKFASLKAENKDKDIRINRIVLYIDDLDRCPPNKVVDVLQAVHLLLAFPLFVVVVGVDARWVTRSLEARYQQLLHSTPDGSKNDAEEIASETLIGVATPGDYLEKIFQIPFWLNPMDQDSRNRMVSGLLKGDLVSKEAGDVKVTQEGSNDNPEIKSTSDEGAGGIKTSSKKAVKTATSGEPSTVVETSPGEEPFSALKNQQPASSTADLLNQQKLEILPEELEFIGTLTPLLGRSPRALKRFVNVYRLVKVGLSEEELESFTDVGKGLADSEAILFLLAIDTGTRSIAERLFQCFREIAVGDPQFPSMPLENKPKITSSYYYFDWLLFKFKRDASPDWLQIKLWLEEPVRRAIWSSETSLKQVGKWVPRVARYSFQSRKI